MPVGGKKNPVEFVTLFPLNTAEGTVPLESWLALFVLMLFVDIVVRFPAVTDAVAVDALPVSEPVNDPESVTPTLFVLQMIAEFVACCAAPAASKALVAENAALPSRFSAAAGG